MSTAPQQTRPPAQPSPEEKRRRRLASYTVRNMVISVVLVGALVMLVWAMLYNPAEREERPAEVALTARYAAEESDFPVWVPEPGDDWFAQVTWFEPRVESTRTWFAAYRTPSGEWLAISQAADVPGEWVREVTSGGDEVATQTLPSPVGSVEFTAYEGPRPSNAEVAYLLGPEATEGSTVVVHGTAELDEVEEFLTSMSAQD